MKNKVTHYLTMTNEEKETLVEKSIIVFDTNVLLNLYRISKKSRNSQLEAMKDVNERLWMPYHVSYEFMNNRYKVLYEIMSREGKFKKAKKTFLMNLSIS